MEIITTMRYESPAGELLLGAIGTKLCQCDWTSSLRRETNDRRICRSLNARYEEGISDTLRQAAEELDEYFSGERRDFSMQLCFAATEFQSRVWASLMEIPYGSTTSYGDIAGRIGNPRGVRAVAGAIASNPLSIFVPCHRVLGADRRLTGYAGGLAAKAFLLELETGRATASRPFIS